jgi:hypothetical protein
LDNLKVKVILIIRHKRKSESKCIVMPTEMERKNEMPFNTFKEHRHET